MLHLLPLKAYSKSAVLDVFEEKSMLNKKFIASSKTIVTRATVFKSGKNDGTKRTLYSNISYGHFLE